MRIQQRKYDEVLSKCLYLSYNSADIEAVTRTDLFRQVIAIIIPPKRYYMHLTLHSSLAKTMKIFTVENRDINNNIYLKPKWILHGCDVHQAL